MPIPFFQGLSPRLGAPCSSSLRGRSDQGVRLRREESSNIIFQTLLFLLVFPFLFFFSFDSKSGMVTWTNL